MKTKTIKVMTKEEVKNISPENTRLDVTTKERLDACLRTIDELQAEVDAVKKVAKTVLGKDGDNGVFSTETRKSYLLNIDELTELIGADMVKKLKNRLSEKTYVHF